MALQNLRKLSPRRQKVGIRGSARGNSLVVWQGIKLLVLGGGGREHTLVWKFMGDGHQDVCAAGNQGIAQSGAVCQALDFCDAAAIVT